MIGGCASGQTNFKHKDFNRKTGEIPQKDILSSAYTGDAIYQLFDYITPVESVKFANNYSQRFSLAKLNIGSHNILYSIDKNNYVMYCSEEKVIKQIGSSDFACFVDSDNDGLFDSFSNKFSLVWTKIKNPMEAQYEIVDMKMKSGFKREIISNGISNNTINLEYREYKDSIARPAFYQNLKYEFNREETQIRYKDVKIQILSANNNEIRYIILGQ